jgi:hypothetical protein
MGPGKTLNNAYLLKLLANSFNTTFPAGTQLAFDGQGDAVQLVDKSGSNVVMDITPVFSINFGNSAYTSLETDTESITKTGTKESETYSDSGTGFLTYSYDDSTQTTADGTHTTFQFSGLASYQDTDIYGEATYTQKTSFTSKGTASGTLQGVDSVIDGSVTGSASGTAPN